MKREKPDTEHQRNPVEELAESFIARHRRGEGPEISEYTAKYPDLAEEIREVFPALLLVERLGGKNIEENEAPSLKEPLRRLGEYVILREVGRGGMGVVYEAEDEKLRRRVALKVLSFHQLMDDRRLVRFQREARAAASLRHPNIVPVFGVGNEEGVYYYTMQLVPGQGLDEVLEEIRRLRSRQGSLDVSKGSGLGPESLSESTVGLLRDSLSDETALPVDPVAHKTSDSGTGTGISSSQSLLDKGHSASKLAFFRNVAAIGARVAEALEYAHDQGVLHRDIKPSNLILEPSGHVWVTDFGLAKPVDSDVVTVSGEVVGTLPYLAPERLDGWSDPRSDVYGLGVTLYELLTLRVAFEDRDRAQLVKKITENDPDAPRLHEPSLPRDLETIVLKAIAKEPANRYRSMGQLAHDLRCFLEDKPILAQRPSVLRKALMWSQRNKPAVAALALMLLLVVTLCVSTAFVWRASERAEAERTRAEGLYLTAQSSVEVASNPGRALILALEGASRNPGHLANNSIVSALDALHEHKILIGHEDVRYATFSFDGKRVLTLSNAIRVWDVERGDPLFDLQADKRLILTAVSPDGTRALTVPAGGGTARIWDVETGSELVALEGDVDAGPAAIFSPGGKWLLIPSTDGGARIWQLSTGRLHLSHQDQAHEVYKAISPNGELLVMAERDSGVARVRSARTGGKVIAVGNAEKGPVLFSEFSPDGDKVVTADAHGTASIWDVETRELIARLHGHDGQILSAAFDSAGKRIVTGGWDETARIWDATTGEELFRFGGHEADVLSARFSPGGDRVVTAAIDGTTRVWNVPKIRAFASVESSYAQLSRDGTLLVTITGPTACVWNVATGMKGAELVGHRDLVKSARFSVDGERIVTASFDGTARIWNSRTGEEVHRLAGHEDDVYAASFSPGGRRVVTASHDGTARVWSAETGQQERLFEQHGRAIWSAAFGPDGDRIVIASSDHAAYIWSSTTGKTLARLTGHENTVTWAEFSADGKQVVTASDDETARIWNARTGHQAMILRGHEKPLHCARFSPNGKQVVTASEDKTARVWDVTTGQTVVTLDHDYWVHVAQFSPDASRIVVASSQPNRLKFWPAPPYVPLASQLKPRELTPDERDLFPVGTQEERERYRREWNENLLLREKKISKKLLGSR